MSVNTYCAWANTAANADAATRRGSHARCPGTSNGAPCDCECHQPEERRLVDPNARPPYTTLEDAPPEVSAEPSAPPRRQWTDDEKRRVVEEYTAAPVGTKSAVLRAKGVSNSMVHRWADQLGVGTGPRGGARPNTGPKPVEVDTFTRADHVGRLSDIVDDGEEEDQVTIDLDPGDRDVLDAVAFLAGMPGGADIFVADLVSDLVTTKSIDPDVMHLVELRRRARASEA